GERSAGTISLTLAANESRQFNSQDIEAGNVDKGLSGSFGDGSGDWSVIVGTTSDIEALAFIRTPDGFLTSMHERVVGDGSDWFVPMFNPAQNPNQVSRLRVINTETVAVSVMIEGIDDAGVAGDSAVSLTIPALESVELSSVDLESGNAGAGLSGAFGDGTGKWQLNVAATGRISVQSLLFDPAGYLTNLSSIPDQSELSSGERVLWFVPPASNEQQQGFVRITNRGNTGGLVTVTGVDDAGQPSAGSITFTLPALASQQFNSQDIEFGNADKGLSGSFGDGSGDWRVHVESDLDFVQMAYIRTPDGFLTAMHDVVASSDGLTTVVPMFNPAQNPNQVSELRLVNPGVTDASISIVGRDDPGLMGPGGAVTLTLPAGQAIALSSTDIEQGNAGKGLTGAIGDGSGKWVLTVTSSVPIKAMSLLRDPRGYLTNLSNVAKGGSGDLDP
ncbi:MAG TPA: hypothetical protein VFY12_08515, partial [Arenimonas sp.]|nr:hypothetical protein [Arenimonas sp.]